MQVLTLPPLVYELAPSACVLTLPPVIFLNSGCPQRDLHQSDRQVLSSIQPVTY